ncbi:hypothetical protein [Caproicibacter sp.]|uniref:hypothetical protein n=1 Tax=Caproicibacter sp. TaxID=2814884 RepID=UPI003988CD65
MRKQIYSRAGRIGCLVLALICSVSLPTAAAASGESTKKDETVYVNLSAAGSVQSTTVSDWLHSDSSNVRIADRSNLTDIKNVKSSDQPLKTGDNLTWVLSGGDSGADVYYQGKTTSATPLKVAVSYELNGKFVTPEQLAGKSGKVKITVDLKNTDAHTVQVDGKDVIMYTPMTAIVAATLPSDTFSNVAVNKGKVISDGNNQFVTFLSMPGLSESLDLKNCGVEGLDTIDIPEDLVITADAKDFTLSSIAIAATPELPDQDELGSENSLDDLKDDLDKLSSMQDNIEAADPNKDIRSLFTNPDRTAAARLIVDDVFHFYDLDTAALDVMPKYVTDQNISLYDRVTSDIDKADLKYIMDNQIIRGLNDRLTDENVAKAKTLLKDYDDIETFKIGKLNRVIQVLNHYDKAYNHLDDIMKDAKHILYRLDDDDIDTLAALSDSSVQNSLSDTLDSMNTLSEIQKSSGLSGDALDLTKDDVKALLNSIVNRKLTPITEEITNLAKEDGTGNINAAKLIGFLSTQDLGQPDLEEEITEELTSAFIKANSTITIPSSSLSSLKTTDNLTSDDIKGLQTEIAALISEGKLSTDGNGNLYVAQLLSDLPGMGLPSEAEADLQSQMIQIVLHYNSDATIPAGDVNDIMSSLDTDLSNQMDGLASQLTPALKSLMSNSETLQTSLTKKLGSNYSSKLTSALTTLGKTQHYINDLQDDLDDLDDDDEAELEDDFEDAKDLLLNKDDMDYLITWASKLKSMKTDMDDNTENISILRDLINLNDDPKIKNFRGMVPSLLKDYDDSEPILDSIKAELDDPAVNASLHKMPQTTQVLTKMEDDIRSNRKIMEIFRLTTQPNTVSLFQDTFNHLDEFTQKGTADHMRTLMDKKDAYTDLSDQYKIFTEVADGAETSVKFVYKTAEIKEPEPVKTAAVQPAENSGKSDSGSGLWGWIRSAWNSAASTISHLF